MTFHYNNIGSTIVLTNEEGEVEEILCTGQSKISLTDPFGLSPNISISGIGHSALDLLGVIPGFDLCDAINTAWYLKEGDYENAALSAAACIPLLGSVVGNGLK